MRLILFIVLHLAHVSLAFSQDLRAYQFFNEKGKKVDFSQVIKAAKDKEVVCFGELHNDPVIHWLQLELTDALSNQRSLTLGAEMFERDDQLVLDEYLAGTIKESHLESDAKLWPNYETDYRPLVEWAKENQVKFVATNVPRRYASLVARSGIEALDDLSEEAKSVLPKLPYTVRPEDRGYDEMKEMMGGGHGHGMGNMIAAQALKDYTMAQSVLEHLDDEHLFIHYNGSFHSQYRDGMVGYMTDVRPDLKVLVIATVASETMDYNEEWDGLGDIILVTPERMTKTH